MNLKLFSLKYLCNFVNNSFIIHYYSESKIKTYKYAIVIKEIEKCLRFFEQHNIKGTGIVLDVSEHRPETCVLLLGILNQDCFFYSLDFKRKDFHSHLGSSGLEYAITKDIKYCKDIFSEVYGSVQVFEHEFYIGKIKKQSTPQPDGLNQASLCYAIATSGSTGSSKMVYVPYNCIEPNISSLCFELKIIEDDVIFLGSPPTFDPFVVELFMALKTGAAVLIANQKMCLTSNVNLWKEVTILQTTPSLFRLWGSNFIRDVIFQTESSLRCLLLGGEPFPSAFEIKSWLPKNFKFGTKRIFNIYGITEVSCWSTICEYQSSNIYQQQRIPLGQPLDDLTLLRIVNEDDDKMAPPTGCFKGQLLIGSSVRQCYVPESDTNATNTGSIVYRNSGDIVERDMFGNIYYIGRSNNCIKRFGKRLCLESLAATIERLSQHNTVCLWDDNNKKLIFCLKGSCNDGCNSRILQNVLETVQDFEQPDEICYVDELPLNNHGKVDRKKLLQHILSKNQTNNKSAFDIFNKFLKDVMAYNSSPQQNETQQNKRFKHDICFTAAGGTSFQALSLSLEIGQLMENPEEQRKLLEMLLSMEISIQEINEFLRYITPVKKQDHLRHHQELAAMENNIKLLWRADFKKCVDASPTIFKDTYVAVGSHSRILLTLNLRTGEEISRTTLADRIECPVVFVSSELAVVGCYDGFLYGFDFNNGTILWKLNVDGMVKARPLLLNDLLIVASYAENFNIKAFNLQTLECVWSFKLGSKGIFSSPLKVTDSMAIFCSLDGSYTLVDVARGIPKWMRKLDSPIFSTPATIETNSNRNELILAEVSGKIKICNVDNGDVITQFEVDGNIFSSLTLCRRNKTLENILILFGCHDGYMYCLNYEPLLKKLSIFWKYTLNAPVYAAPIITFENTVLACSTKGLMVILDMNTGKLKAMYDVKADIFSTPCVLNSRHIYVGSRDNFLYAFEIQ